MEISLKEEKHHEYHVLPDWLLIYSIDNDLYKINIIFFSSLSLR